MKIPRRQFLCLAASAAALAALPRRALALDYPTRPVRLFEGFGAGSLTDVTARLIGHRLSEQLGQPFVVENRVGADSNIATEVVVRASPDGYTLLTCTSANAINATLYEKLNFNFIRDIAPIAGLFRLPLVLLINQSLPAKTFPEFIAYAKANPGKLNMASPGSNSHVSGELLKMMTGVDIVIVPYRGPAPAFTALLAGQVQVMFAPVAMRYVGSDRVRALAVSSATRWSGLPNLPPIADFVPGYEASGWMGIGAPRGTPAAIIDKLNSSINDGLADPQLNARIKGLGGDPMPMTPTKFGAFIAEQTEKWAKVAKFSGAKAGP